MPKMRAKLRLHHIDRVKVERLAVGRVARITRRLSDSSEAGKEYYVDFTPVD